MRRFHVVAMGVVCAVGLSRCADDAAPCSSEERPEKSVAVRLSAPKSELQQQDPGPRAVREKEAARPTASSAPKRRAPDVGLMGGSSAGHAFGAGGLALRGAGTGGGGKAGGGLIGTGGGAHNAGVGHVPGAALAGRSGLDLYGTGGAALGGRGRIQTGPVVVRGYGGAPPSLPGGSVFDRAGAEAPGSEDYGQTRVNEWTLSAADHLSTFGVDVDTASYALARAKLLSRQLPPQDSVRVEEWLNAFKYGYAAPSSRTSPFAVHLDAAPSPFARGKHLLRVGLQARQLDLSERKPAHLTFLVDVSGSMNGEARLPLAKQALMLLVDQLREEDTVALVTYASDTRVVLPHTGMDQRWRILAAVSALQAGGSTAMGSGLELAYQQALKTLDSKSISRVIILSDGDANVGETNHEALVRSIRRHAQEGVTITTVGLGMGNYKSALMEQLADKGNGNHYYVDSMDEARKVFVEQLGSTLEVIAQDVKLQVDFDPEQVNAWRLVGYENRHIADRDFRNDRVDAGEIGSGHTVTALYELDLHEGAGEGLVTVRVRAKRPRGVEASEQAFVFPKQALAATFAAASADLRFATAVMGAAEILRGSPDAAEWSLADVRRIGGEAAPSASGDRAEFLMLMGWAEGLLGARPAQQLVRASDPAARR